MVSVNRDVVEAKQHRPVGVGQPPPILRVLVLQLGQGPGTKPVLSTVQVYWAYLIPSEAGCSEKMLVMFSALILELMADIRDP